MFIFSNGNLLTTNIYCSRQCRFCEFLFVLSWGLVVWAESEWALGRTAHTIACVLKLKYHVNPLIITFLELLIWNVLTNNLCTRNYVWISQIPIVQDNFVECWPSTVCPIYKVTVLPGSLRGWAGPMVCLPLH